MEGIFSALQESAITCNRAVVWGIDFSTLRRAGRARGPRGRWPPGPGVLHARVDTMCATLQNTSERRGAMMATLRCDHPDIEEYIDAKPAARAGQLQPVGCRSATEFMARWPLTAISPGLSCRCPRRRRAGRPGRDAGVDGQQWGASPVGCGVVCARASCGKRHRAARPTRCEPGDSSSTA